MSPVASLDLVLTNSTNFYRGRPTKTMPSSSSVSFSLRRILLPSEVTSECGVTGLSSATSWGCDADTSEVEGTGVDSFGVGGEMSFVVKVSDAVSGGGGGAFGSEISRRVSTISWRTRIARSPTSAAVKPSVETGGSTLTLKVPGLKTPFTVDVPVVLRYYGDNREASLDGKVKSTLLEGLNVVKWT